MDHLGRAAVTSPWAAATIAAVDVGNAVAALREPLASLVASDRLAAQEQADRFAHDTLVSRLSAQYPGVPIVSEEDAAHHVARMGDYWLIDPIDGTASWSAGFAGFVCQLARIMDNTVVFSVIHAPLLEMTWTAVRGEGAYLDGQRLPLRRPAPPTGVIVVDNYPEPRGVCDRIMRRLGTAVYLESGSIGLKAALVATGRADLFVKDVVVRDWDVAPALAIAHEVGAFVSGVDGKDFPLSGPYDKPDGLVVAADASLGIRVVQWLAASTPRS